MTRGATKSFLLAKGNDIAMISDADNMLGHKNCSLVIVVKGITVRLIIWDNMACDPLPH